MLTNKMKEVTRSARFASSELIKCLACGRSGVRCAVYSITKKDSSIFSSERRARRERSFESKICADCSRFWALKAHDRKKEDEKTWEFAEAEVERFFATRDIPVARTVKAGPDIIVQLFRQILKIEVKSGWFANGNIVANIPTYRRMRDDLVVVVLPPNNGLVWFPMQNYLSHVVENHFVFSRQEYESTFITFSFERALVELSAERNLGISQFVLIKKGIGT